MSGMASKEEPLTAFGWIQPPDSNVTLDRRKEETGPNMPPLLVWDDELEQCVV